MNLLRRAEGVTFGDVTYAPGGTCGPRVQQDVQLVLMYDGDARVRVDGSDLPLGAQVVALMRPGHLEHFVFSRRAQTHHRWCAITPSLIPGDLRAQIGSLPATLPLSAHLHGLIELGLSLPEAASTRSVDALMQQLALTALRQYALEAETLGQASALPRALVRAQQHIDTHLTEHIRAADVARAVNVTPQHLGKLFRTHLRTTPARYLWQARARRGTELLYATGLTVAEIAERCGFQNPFHFSRVIKAHYGHSPRALRQRSWSQLGR